MERIAGGLAEASWRGGHVSRRRTLELHRHSLGEVRGIMHAMKTLAYLETHKLARFLEAQHASVQCIAATAADFLSFHPLLAQPPASERTAYLLIGAERGFCGDFNQRLLRQLEQQTQALGETSPLLLVVGHKLQLLLEDDPRVVARIDGAGVAEEVGAVLGPLTDTLGRLQAEAGVLRLRVLYHSDERTVQTEQLLPPFQAPPQPTPALRQPPLLNLPPDDFLLALTDHYLLAALYRLLYTSLMAENYRRLSHLEGALQHLDEKTAALARRSNVLRQEEIIEEIEVILLSAGQHPEGQPTPPHE
jgi:F-type H+-transporting ATPase subunit gamma